MGLLIQREEPGDRGLAKGGPGMRRETGLAFSFESLRLIRMTQDRLTSGQSAFGFGDLPFQQRKRGRSGR